MWDFKQGAGISKESLGEKIVSKTKYVEKHSNEREVGQMHSNFR